MSETCTVSTTPCRLGVNEPSTHVIPMLQSPFCGRCVCITLCVAGSQIWFCLAFPSTSCLFGFPSFPANISKSPFFAGPAWPSDAHAQWAVAWQAPLPEKWRDFLLSSSPQHLCRPQRQAMRRSGLGSVSRPRFGPTGFDRFCRCQIYPWSTA